MPVSVLLAKSIVLFKAMGLFDTSENTKNVSFNHYAFNHYAFNYYVKNAKANFIEEVLNDDVEIVNIDATHENWFEFDDIITQIVNKILEDLPKKKKSNKRC